MHCLCVQSEDKVLEEKSAQETNTRQCAQGTNKF